MSSRRIRFFPKTPGFRLVLWYSMVFFLCTLGLMAAFYFYLAHNLEEKDRLGLVREADELSLLYQKGGAKALRGKAPAFHSYLVRIAAPSRKPLLVGDPEDWEEVDLNGLDAQLQKPWKNWFRVDKREEDGKTVSDDGFEFCSVGLADGWSLQVGLDTERREELLRNYRGVFELAFIPMVLLGMLAGSFLAFNNILNPVRRLTGTLQTILEGDLSARVPEDEAKDELGRLTRLFNQMLNRIESLVKGMRQSTDNVAHDLRTPLTRLKMLAESVLQKKSSPSNYREALADCVEEADRILSMLNTLMDISEAESGVMKLNLEVFPLSGLLGEVAELYQHVAEEKNVRLRWQAPPGTTALADRGRLLQVLANLLDNALKYTSPGGSVELEARFLGGSMGFTVKDNGMGINPEDLPHIWERLYRGDRSRSQKGMGLGLSLVKAVVDAHKGTVSVDSEPGQGTIFTVKIPSPKPTNL